MAISGHEYHSQKISAANVEACSLPKLFDEEKIDPVACRYGKEFHAGDSPYRTVIFSILGTYTLLFHFKM